LFNLAGFDLRLASTTVTAKSWPDPFSGGVTPPPTEKIYTVAAAFPLRIAACQSAKCNQRSDFSCLARLLQSGGLDGDL